LVRGSGWRAQVCGGEYAYDGMQASSVIYYREFFNQKFCRMRRTAGADAERNMPVNAGQ
jgi:hypothetical protein